ncbi:MAG: twin-arginine translocase TatA/TatE family subunit [Desulfurococcales archaeon]|nr:twin-arginine translocase TatA/TatE family subunit [Desulfurococcales archaeon]MEB3788835.1 twin-arginine translocase TatA/TatE family subunit [Desulfurococcales archaeon]
MGAFLQGSELWIILVILLLLLGPTKLPALARGLGQAMREFRKASQGLYDEDSVKNDLAALQSRSPQQTSSKEEEELIRRLAEKLGINQEGKSIDQIRTEVLDEAKKKGLA